MKIVISGLGRMGMQIAEKLVKDGHDVIAHNRSSDKVDTAVAFGAHKAYTKEEAVAHFGDEQHIVWIMLPAGVVEGELKSWLELLPQGSLLIDGGNSDYRLAHEQAKIVNDHGSQLIDVGTSGGVTGLKDGFCMMVGGNPDAYAILQPVLTSLSMPRGGYDYFGEVGAGHYVKMVHNAIEYGMMESIAEGYRMLAEGPYKDIDLAKAGDVWQKNSIIASNLNALTTEALHENPTLDGVDGYVAESGEARWTLEAAKERDIPLPAIQAAFDVRVASEHDEGVSITTKLVAVMRNKFGGHQINK
jgi:6-phosphogluconate dehydrogenase